MKPIFWPYLAATSLAHGLVAAPLSCGLRLAGAEPQELKQRLGFYPKLLASSKAAGPRLWMQAASVGEVRLAVSLLEDLKEQRANLSLVLSAGTRAGFREAARLAGDLAEVVYFPLDSPLSVVRALKAVRPEMVVLLETELWPIFLWAALGRQIKVVLANGRISDRTALAYRLMAPAFRPLLARFTLAAVISQRDADRLKHLGVPAERIFVTGNAKAGSLPAKADLKMAQRLQERLGLKDRPVWVAGSIRSGEISQVVEAFRRVKAEVPEAVLVVAPRHLRLVRELAKSLRRAGLDFKRRSQIASTKEPVPQVVILDTMGELFDLYASARVALAGGSLVPLGGQNPLEPAHWGVPVLFGPHMDDFREVADDLLQAGGASLVLDADDLARQVCNLLTDQNLNDRMGLAARQVCLRQTGAAKRTIELVLKALDLPQPGGDAG